MSYLTDKEKRLLFSALSREKKVCEEVDKECCREPYETPLKIIVEDLESKFYYDRFEKEIRDRAIEEMKTKLCEKANWLEKYTRAFGYIERNFCELVSEIAEQMKEVENEY